MTIIKVIFFGAVMLTPQTEQDARTLLASTHPFASPVMILTGTGDASDLTAYKRQIEAINTLAQDPKSEDVALLIPFLNYTTSAVDVLFSTKPTVVEDLNKTRSTWPTFAAILATPNCAKDLRQYILNDQNPLAYRLTAFTVLRYTDLENFKATGKILDAEFSNADRNVKTYILSVENGSTRFHGIPKM